MLAASGCLSLPLDNLRILLAACTTLQTLLGVSNATDAKSKIYWLETDDVNVEEEASLPRVIVGFAVGHFQSTRITTSGWSRVGPLEVLFEIETPAEYVDNLQDGNMWFTNSIGDVMSEMEALTISNPEYLNVTSASVDFAGRVDPDKNSGSRYYAAGLTIEWRGI